MSIDRTAKDHLKSFVERIERLEEEKKSIADDIKDIYAEAKGNGFDVKALRYIVRLRKMDKDKRDEFESIIDVYREALGMLADTPLGAAAIERAAKAGPAAARRARSKDRLTGAMEDHVEFTQELGSKGLISQEAAAEAARDADAVSRKLGNGKGIKKPEHVA